MLYFSSIDWAWIKQRPQFIAEALNNHIIILVLYPYIWLRKGLQYRNDNLKKMALLHLPFQGKLLLIYYLNAMVNYMTLWVVNVLWKPDYVFFSSPHHASYESIFKCIKIYDVMDNYVALSSFKDKQLVHKQEKRLLVSSNVVIASSFYLKNI